jgi:putative SOS response-associated peptidase YedK
MCGRVTVRASAEDLQEHFGFGAILHQLERPRYNLTPTQQMVVVANTAERELDLYRWGLVPTWAKDLKIGNKLTNARSEGLETKPSFRNALKRRRCVILIDGFYEWKREGKTKAPFFFHRKDQKPFALAGLWEQWSDPAGTELRTCTVITTAANKLMSRIHDRMPVILSPDQFDLWLSPDPKPPEALLPLLVPVDGELECYAVSSLVNAAKNDVVGCLNPAEAAAQQALNLVQSA